MEINRVLLGAIGMASIIAGVFFARFWRDTRDRFFGFFAASFLIEGVNRLVLGMYNNPSEEMPIFYLIRLVAILLIVAAIIDKNRGRRT